MTEVERKQIKGALLKCADENANKMTPTGYVVVSSICRSAVERIVELESQVEQMVCCGNCGNEKCTSKYRGNSAYHTQTDGYACAGNEDWVMRKPRSEKDADISTKERMV